MIKDHKAAIIICAGGIGERMGAGKPKQFIEIADGVSIIRKTVDAFRSETVSRLADIIVVTAPEDFVQETDRLVNQDLPELAEQDRQELTDQDLPESDGRSTLKNAGQGMPENAYAHVIAGGGQRQDSVRNALAFLSERGLKDDDVVLIHDGARPFITSEIIMSVAEAVLEHDAAIAAVPVKDTIRDSENGTLDRSRLYSVQTPQGFRFGLIRDAVEQACEDGFYGTDDGSLAERAGVMPVIVPGSYSNIKITTPEDL